MHAMDLVEQLRAVNERLRLWLDNASPLVENGPTIGPDQMSAVLSELMQAGALLQRCSQVSDEPMHNELSLYREHVQRLRTLLPSLHDSLLREREQLALRLARVQSASEWVEASRQTL